MKVFIGLISQSREWIKCFRDNNEALVKKELLTGRLQGCNFKFDAFSPGKAQLDVVSHLQKSIMGSGENAYDLALIIVDELLYPGLESIKNALFFGVVDTTKHSKNLQSEIMNVLDKLLKNLLISNEIMSDLGNEQAMRLPVRNFKSEELNRLCEIYTQVYLIQDFQKEVMARIGKKKGVLKTKRPRRSSSSKEKYFVDNEDKHFSFGSEEHSKVETKPPHNSSCIINGNFRFGKKISVCHHFNVSKGDSDETYIDGNFINCHDERICIKKPKGKTHLNMFTNDFFKTKPN
jgi:hypothetical protein